MGTDELLTTAEVAPMIGKSIRTTARLAQTGALPYAERLPFARGIYRFRRRDVLDYLRREDEKASA